MTDAFTDVANTLLHLDSHLSLSLVVSSPQAMGALVTCLFDQMIASLLRFTSFAEEVCRISFSFSFA